jgi:hypothetical protein
LCAIYRGEIAPHFRVGELFSNYRDGMQGYFLFAMRFKPHISANKPNK